MKETLTDLGLRHGYSPSMASFAERMGHRTIRTLSQSESLDAETRIELWNVTNVLRRMLHDAYRDHSSKAEEKLLAAVWTWKFKQPADEQPARERIWIRIKSVILESDWFDALDVIEQLIGYLRRYVDGFTQAIPKAVLDAYNNRFEHFLVPFRFIDDKITPIDSQIEIDSITAALSDAEPFAGARHHLDRALELLADRAKPDYANSIKESISAVEAICASVTGEKTLGAALKKLTSSGVVLHPALEQAWSKMYGWTSDANGIRHGGLDPATADQSLAKYALVTCSAFVSFVIESARKSGLL